MTHPRLALNSLSTASWPLERDLELYVELGVGHAGFLLDKLDAATPDRAVDLIRSSGVGATQVFARGTTPSDPGQWPEDQARLCRAVDLAVELGGSCVTVTTGPAGDLGWDAAAEAMGVALGPVVGHGRQHGVTLAIEQTLPVRPEIGFVHSFADTVELAERFDLGVALESNYCCYERHIDQSVHAAGSRLAMVQLSDLVPPANALPDRAVPGDGVLPLGRMVATALAAGYQGFFELEQLGPRIESEGYAEACRRGVAVIDQLLVDAGA
jgi:sugar phosphate isomerase/epimerase